MKIRIIGITADKRACMEELVEQFGRYVGGWED